VNDVNTIHRATEDVALHAIVHVAGAQVGLTDLRSWPVVNLPPEGRYPPEAKALFKSLTIGFPQ